MAEDEGDTSDERTLDCPAYTAIQGAAVLGRVATRARAGHRVMRVGSEPSMAGVPSGGGLHAASGGFDLHAGVGQRAARPQAGRTPRGRFLWTRGVVV